MLRLVPKPYKFTLSSKDVFNVTKCDCFDIVSFDKMLQLLNCKIAISNSFKIDNDPSNEGYDLSVSNSGLSITASSNTGLFYAYISLIQLIINYDWALPCVNIIDKPNYKYRGLMLDVGRYFFSIADLKRIAQLCALHKINKLHLHLTEDQGWRIEIKSYPLLTKIGSIRSHTNFNHKQHKGFYTQAELRELVDYCSKLSIEIIPEIDMPGHSQAALAAYPNLGCFNRKLPVATHWGVKHDIVCAGKDSSYSFEKTVLNEIFNIFDSKYVHIGGDEAIKTRWKICPNCQEKIKALGLKNEEELQAYFINDISNYIIENNRIPITWNETTPSGLASKSIVWQLWDVNNNNNNLLINESFAGRYLIYSKSNETYLDLPCSKTSLSNCYNLNDISDFNKNQVLGIEAAIWTEFIPTIKTACKKALPRLGALCEAMWSCTENKNYDAFINEINYYYKFISHFNYPIGKLKYQMPNKIACLIQNIWFERRQFTWHGLHNLIDNINVNRIYKK